MKIRINFDKEKIGKYTISQLKRQWNNPSASRGVKEGRFEIDKVNNEKALKVIFPKGCVGPQEGGGSWKLKLEKKYHLLFLQYQIMLPKEFNFVRGGKLPGLSGGTSPAGGSKNTEGFSARVMWRVDHFWDKHKIKNPYKAYLTQYVYYPSKDPKKRWGLDIDWSNNKRKVYLTSGKWHTIKIRIKLSGGQDIIESWFDGKKVLSRRLTLRRTNQKFGIENLYFSAFFGGNEKSWAPKKKELIYFKDFIISDKKIK